MAKQKGRGNKIDSKQIDTIDDLDWPDFDFSDLEEAPAENDRSPVKRVSKTAIRSAAKYAADPRNIEKGLKRSMPGEYGRAVGVAGDTARAAKSLYDTTYSELSETARDMQKTLRQALPRFKGKVPDRAYALLEKLQGQPDFEYNAQSAEQSREGEINRLVDEVMVAREKQRVEDRERNEAEKLQEKAQARKRYSTTLGVLGAIADETGMQRAYMEEVDAPWKRASLKLQYRSNYLLADLVNLNTQVAKDVTSRLDAVIKNTALPEAQKISQSEEFRRLNQQRILNRIGEGVFGSTGEYLGNLFQNVSERATNSLKDRLRSLRTGFRDAAGAASDLDSVGEGAGEETLIELLVGAGGDWATKRYGDRARSRLEKNTRFNRFQGETGYVLNNLGRTLNGEARKRSNDYSLRGQALDFLRGTLARKDLSGALPDDIIEKGHMPDNFNRMTNRALIDIIPGLLARIHHEQVKTRTGDDNVPMIRYDVATGTFTDLATSTERVKGRLVSGRQADRNNREINGLIESIDPTGKLSSKQRSQLAKHLVELNMRQLRFSPEDIIRDGTFFGSSSRSDIEGFKDFFRGEYGISSAYDVDGKAKTSYSDRQGYFDRINKQSKTLNDLSTNFKDPTAFIKTMLEQGSREELIQLGLLDISSGVPRINYDRAVEFYLGGGHDLVGGQNSVYSPAGRSGDRVPVYRRGNRSGVQGTSKAAAPRMAFNGRAASPVIDYSRVEDAANQGARRSGFIAGTTEEWLEAIHSAIRQGDQSQRLDMLNLYVEEIMSIMTDGRLMSGGGGGTLPQLQEGSLLNTRWSSRMKRLRGSLGRGLSGLQNRARGLLEFKGRMLSGLGTNIAAGYQNAKQYFNDRKGRIVDVYVKGFNFPALTAQRLKMGEYYDQATNAVITRLSDIKGPVVDKLGNVVLTLEDLQAGLTDRSGKQIVLDGLSAAKNGVLDLSKYLRGRLTTAGSGLYGLGGNLFTKAYNKLQELGDVYVKGEKQPRLLKHILKAGGYYDSATKAVITRFEDIKGNVVDSEGNLVLSMEEMRKGLVDRWGKPIRGGILRALGRVGDFRRNATEFVGKKLSSAKNMVLGGWKRLRGFFKGGMRGISEGQLLAPVDGTQEGYLASQLNVQMQILAQLVEMNPNRKTFGDASGDGVRDGSYADIMKRRALSARDKAAALAARVKGSDGWGKLSGALGALLKGRGGSGEDEDGGTSIDVDYWGGDGEGKGKRKPRGPKPRGRFGKAWDWLKRSRVGRLGSRLVGPLGGTLGRIGLGTAARAAGGFLLRGAIGVAGVAAGIVSAPVAAGIGLVAAVGTAGYYLYKWYDSSKDRPLQKFRLAQYGWDTKDEDKAKKLVAFESLMLKHTSKGANPEISMKAEDMREALELFGIDSEKPSPAFVAFSHWFTGRFKPLFIAHVTALNKIDKSVSLSEVDDKLKPSQKRDYFSAVKAGPGVQDAYRQSASPFGQGVNSNTRTALIDAVGAEVQAKLDEMGDDRSVTHTGLPLPKGSVQPTSAAPVMTVGEKGTRIAAKAALTAVPVLGAALAAAGTITTASAGETTKSAVGLVPASKVDALRAARFRTYGLLMLDRNWVRALIELEEMIVGDILVRGKGSAEYRGDIDKLTDRIGAYFGVGDRGSSSWGHFQSWFKARFLPAYLIHYTTVKAAAPGINPGEAHLILDAKAQYDLAVAVSAAQGEWQGERTSVWSIPLAPAEGLQPNTDRRTIEDNLAALKDGITQKRLDEEAGKAGGTKDGRQAETKGFFSKAVDKIKGWFGFGDDDKSSSQSPSWVPTAGGGSQPRGRSGRQGGSADYGGYPSGGSAGGTLVTKGYEFVVDHPGSGDSGDINSLPWPTGKKGFEAHKALISAVAKMTGMDPILLSGLIATESNFNSAAKPGTSAAQGLGQFIPGTWKLMMRKYASKYGIDPNTPATDPRVNALFTALYKRDNAQDIQKFLGNTRKVNAVDIYMAHFLGPDGYKSFLRNPGAIAAKIPGMQRPAIANKTIFYTETGRPRTTDEIVALLGGRVQGNMDRYGKAMREFMGSKAPEMPSMPSTEVQGVDDSGPTPPVGPESGEQPNESATAVRREATSASADISTAPSAPATVGSGSSAAARAEQERASNNAAQSAAKNEEFQSSMSELVELNQGQLTVQRTMSEQLNTIAGLLKELNLASGKQSANDGRQHRHQRPATDVPAGPYSVAKP